MDKVNQYAMHRNGVHVHCGQPADSARSSVSDPGSCWLAGMVENVHGHDFDGPLSDACGCSEDM